MPALTIEELVDAAFGESVFDLSFTAFKRRMWSSYAHTQFHEVIDKHLNSVYQYLAGGDGISRLMIFMPPRYGKTRSVSIHYPAWLLGHLPDTPIILTSYGARLAENNSRAIRNLLRRPDYPFAHVNLSEDRKAAGEWYVQGHGGGVVTAGVSGGITGYGGKLIIIDDPFKSRAEAESETYRQRVKDWYQNDLYTRLESPSAIIVINTRWHWDDLSGWLLSDNVDDWTVLDFPAIAREQDMLGRVPGEVLWPEKHTFDDLQAKAAQMGEYAFEALFQQNPQQSRGRLFDTGRIDIVDVTPPLLRMVRFYDLAVTAKSRASYTVGLKMGITADGILVITDLYRRQAELPDVHQDIVQTAQLDGRGVHIRLEGEKGGIVELQHLVRDARMHGYSMDAQPPRGDKYTRAQPVATQVNYGTVLLKRGAWNKAFLEELSLFPSGANNDQVDAFSGAYQYLTEGGPQELHYLDVRARIGSY